MQGVSLKIGIDVDGTITSAPEFFRILTNCLRYSAEIHIVTARSYVGDKDYEHIKKATEKELSRLRIWYDYIELTLEKGKYVTEKKINVMFEDTDAEIAVMPSSCVCFKTRDGENWDWDNNRWLTEED